MGLIEILMAIVSVACCLGMAQALRMRNRYRQREQTWQAHLQTAKVTIAAAQRETAAAVATVATTQTETLAAHIEISAARSIAVAAEESRMLAMAMAEAVQAELTAMRNPPKPIPKDAKAKKDRPIPKPAAACSCSHCQLESAAQAVGLDAAKAHPLLLSYLWPYVRNEDVIPYADTKSKRGRKKEHNTEGFACPQLDCHYRGITDSAIHALIAYGDHGSKERIPDLYCQACKRKITTRTMTALYIACTNQASTSSRPSICWWKGCRKKAQSAVCPSTNSTPTRSVVGLQKLHTTLRPSKPSCSRI